uniref:Uncharacterized protein n=1 Tax=Rhizophora mucronata TaxID=61149 RepID=A0A2P2J1K1_RHIMU
MLFLPAGVESCCGIVFNICSIVLILYQLAQSLLKMYPFSSSALLWLVRISLVQLRFVGM